MASARYERVQRGIIQPILLVSVGCVLAAAVWIEHLDETPLWVALAAGSFAMTLLSFAFGTLTVRDEGDRLRVRFGPLPLFQKTIPYSDIAAAEPDRSTFLSGWGIHYTSKGWLWNIGGFDCVRVSTGAKSTLIGTDDPSGLAAFLRARIAARGVQSPP